MAIVEAIAWPNMSLIYETIKEGGNYFPEVYWCQVFGVISTYTDFVSYFYTMWISFYIVQVVKNPIKKDSKRYLFYHVSSHGLSAIMITLLLIFDRFGVSENLICGI